eukprot:UN03441
MEYCDEKFRMYQSWIITYDLQYWMTDKAVACGAAGMNGPEKDALKTTRDTFGKHKDWTMAETQSMVSTWQLWVAGNLVVGPLEAAYNLDKWHGVSPNRYGWMPTHISKFEVDSLYLDCKSPTTCPTTCPTTAPTTVPSTPPTTYPTTSPTSDPTTSPSTFPTPPRTTYSPTTPPTTSPLTEYPTPDSNR